MKIIASLDAGAFRASAPESISLPAPPSPAPGGEIVKCDVRGGAA